MQELISRQAVKELAHNQIREKFCGMAFKKYRDFCIKLVDSIIDLLPTIQPEPHWIPVTKEEMFKAGYEGKEIRFRVDGRLFAIRELAQ